MHELSVMSRVLDIALQIAEENNGKEVSSIKIEIGVMSGIVPAHATKFFNFIAKDTIAKDAILEFIDVPANFLCNGCKSQVIFSEPTLHPVCKECGSSNMHLESGRGFKMTEVIMI